MVNIYTQDQKKEYFKSLRDRWTNSKKLASEDQEAQALYRESITTTISGKISYWSFYFTLMDMKREGFSDLPYIDCKTFEGWRKSGFKVKKGEKSRIDGIVWLRFGSKGKIAEEINPLEEEVSLYPKLYHLFHKSQVGSIA